MKVLHEEVTPYNHILVEERDGEMLLYSPPRKLQGRVYKNAPDEVALVSTRTALKGLVFMHEPSSILVIGLGAGLFPRAMSRLFPRAEITTVEIDRSVVEVAERYFFFKPGAHGRVVVADGHDFVREAGSIYDVIYLDAYLGFDLPRPMAKPRFFEGLSKILSRGGLFMMNLIPSRRLTRKRALKLLLARFAGVAVLECPGMDNYILAASDEIGEVDIPARAQELAKSLPGGSFDPGGLDNIEIFPPR